MESSNHNIITDLRYIEQTAQEKLEENEAFRAYLRQQDPEDVDNLFHRLNSRIEPKIDCTSCGNCCRAFMIHVTEEEAKVVAARINMTVEAFDEEYLEKGINRQAIMNTIPCKFLDENKCSVYTDRFSQCREFPHLNQPHVTQRLFGLMMYYGTCPIVFNVLEQAKVHSRFTEFTEATQTNQPVLAYES